MSDHEFKNAKFMEDRAITPNTPKPELERYRIVQNGGTEELGLQQYDQGPFVYYDQAADAISRLTAEKEEAVNERASFEYRLDAMTADRDRWLDAASAATKELESVRSIAGASRIALYDELKAAEKRVRELEAEAKSYAALCAENDTLRDDIATYRRLKETAEASNKLLSERVAVLETALEPFAKACEHVDNPDRPDSAGFIGAGLTLGDLRRARSAREAK